MIKYLLYLAYLQVFSLAQYYNVLNVALAAAYPMAVNFLAEGFISVHRIEVM